MGWVRDLRRWHPVAARALLARAFPHFLAQSGALLLLRLDQIMLNAMAGNEQAGIYGAATRLSEVVFILVPVIVASYLPRLAAIEQTESGGVSPHGGCLAAGAQCGRVGGPAWYGGCSAASSCGWSMAGSSPRAGRSCSFTASRRSLICTARSARSCS